MRLYFFIIMFILFYLLKSCAYKYEKLHYYPRIKDTLTCLSDENTFYLGRVLDMNMDSAYQALFFYPDGGCLITSLFYDSLEIHRNFELKNKRMRLIASDTWGFYYCSNDSVYAEFLVRWHPTHEFYRVKHTILVKNDHILVYDGDDSTCFKFFPVETQKKFDPKYNWIKTHRKYN